MRLTLTSADNRGIKVSTFQPQDSKVGLQLCLLGAVIHALNQQKVAAIILMHTYSKEKGHKVSNAENTVSK